VIFSVFMNKSQICSRLSSLFDALTVFLLKLVDKVYYYVIIELQTEFTTVLGGMKHEEHYDCNGISPQDGTEGDGLDHRSRSD